MAPVIIKYPEDLSGTNQNNLVQGEVHQMVRRKVRAIAPVHGGFFTESLRIVDTATQKVLDINKQFVATEMLEDPTELSGKEVCSLILITDTNVHDEVTIQYQAAGGPWCNYAKAIEQLVTALMLDERPVSKNDIVDWPSEFKPSHHLHDVGDTYGWEFIYNALERVNSSMKLRDAAKLDSLYAYIDLAVGFVSPQVLAKIAESVTAVMKTHVDHPDPHVQYLTKVEADDIIIPMVRQPINIAPTNGLQRAGLAITVETSPFYSLYALSQGGIEVQVSKQADFAGQMVVDQVLNGTNLKSYQLPRLDASTTYYWRMRHFDVDKKKSKWSATWSFDTGAVFVMQPSITAPVNGQKVVTNGFTMTSSAFAVQGMTDTHVSTDWEIWSGENGTGNLLFSSYNDTVNKTSIQVPHTILANKTTYYPRVAHKGTVVGASAWSANRSMLVDYPPFPTTIGESYGGGYYAGDVVVDSTTYGIILAPKIGGETDLKMANATTKVIGNDADSVLNTTNLKAFGSDAANWAKALTLGGFSDWQVPSLAALQSIYTNVGPTRATSPVIFKTGAAQAMNAVVHGSSSPYDYIRNDSYSDPDTPIYSSYLHQYASPRSYSAGPQGESAYPSSAVKCSRGEQGPNDVQSSFSSNGSQMPWGEYVGYWEVNWNCAVSEYRTEVVGYTPGAYHDVRTPVFDHRRVNMSTGAVTNGAKNVATRIRAIRLIPKT